MMKQLIIASALTTALSLHGGVSLAVNETPVLQEAQEQDQEQIYGSQLMTQQERTAYRTKMQNIKTAEEREQIRKDHHKDMKERAKSRGVNLPDEPPATGGGMGPGGGRGPGGGMGPGRGMGPGSANGR